MANLNLVIDSSIFKPFDMNTALSVLNSYKDAYYRAEDLLEKLQEDTVNLPEDSKYRQSLDDYNEELDAVAEALSKGLNIKTSLRLSNVRRRYKKDIKPIKEAVESYNKFVDKWLALQALDPSAIRGYNYTVDDFYGGVVPDIGYRSGKDIENEALRYFTGISNALTLDPTFKPFLNDQYNLMISLPGISSKDALTAALMEYGKRDNGAYSDKVLDILNHMDALFKGQNVDDFSDKAKSLIWNSIARGLISSLQAPTYNPVQNLNFESDAAKSTRELQEQNLRDSHQSFVVNMTNAGYEYNKHTGNWVKTKTDNDGNKKVSVWDAEDNETELVKNPADGKFYPKKEDGTPDTSLPSWTDAKVNENNARHALREALKTDISQMKRDKDGALTLEQYTNIGKSFEPFEFRMDNIIGDEDEKRIYLGKKFKKTKDGGAGFKKVSMEYNWANGLPLSSPDSPFTESVKNEILQEARKQNPYLTENDIVAYVEYHSWSADHVRICIRGTGVDGNFDPASKVKGNSSPPEPDAPEFDENKELD